MTNIEAENSYSINVLADRKRLPEVYDLRVDAWEASKSSNIINHQKYPDGFIDEFDDESIHLVATSNMNDKIMSACRVTFFESSDRYPYVGFLNIANFPSSNLALIGRGVRAINFRHKKLQHDFISLSLDICRQHGIAFATGHAYDENVYMQNLMLELGFKLFANLGIKNDKSKDLAFPGKLFVIKLT